MRSSAALSSTRLAALKLALVAVATAGCASRLATTSYLPGSRHGEKAEAAVETAPTGNDPQAVALRKAMGEKPITQDQALAGVLAQLEEIRAIDPEAERELMADLRQAKPEHYPLIVDTFRTALAYRQQLAERNQQLAGGTNVTNAVAATPPVQLAAHEMSPLNGESSRRAAAVQTSLASARSTESTAGQRRGAPRVSPAMSDSHSPSQQMDDVSSEPEEASAMNRLSETGERSAISASRYSRPDATASDEASREPAQQAPAASRSLSGDWKAELETTIVDLQGSVSSKPTSTEELHDHMRLRTLLLLAGREDEAYRPIPGASPAQQDYWSKQLFAMSAYLNAGGKLDDKQRAAAALAPLDEARAKLSELATLQIRNAAFVASVDGFGAYEPRKTTSFRPGQKVTLYAEVENFRSDEREDGFHTSLGTSYQLQDRSGRRIDGKQFPEVTDKCRNRRRDFHMQYEFPLPAAISPGEYNLELTITDHNSGKIAQTTLPFEIGGGR
jgi:hypothetical protein